MIRVVLFDLGQTLVDDQRRPFPHVQLALTTIAGFHTAAGKPLRSALVSDYTMVEPPLTPARIKPVFDEYLAVLAATGLRAFFEPVTRRVTLSTHAGVFKPERKVFEKALRRLQVKASLEECVLFTEDPSHVDAVRQKFGMRALRFGRAGASSVDFSDWSQAPALLAHLLGSQEDSNVHAAIKAHLAARGVETSGVQAGGKAGEFDVAGSTWHTISLPGQPALNNLQVALPMRAKVRCGERGELGVDMHASDPEALAEAAAFVSSLAAHGQIAGVGSPARLPTHTIEPDEQGRPRLVRKRFTAL
jgi:hypothetical protein